MRIAYVNYGNQSGVTPNVVRSLSVLGHRIVPVDPTGILALRDPRTRLPRPTPRVLLSLAASALRHGPQLIHHRLNTVYAFDQHSRRAGELLEALTEPPDVVLQNGALFAPGRPPRFPYVLLLDNTSLLAERQPRAVEAEMGRHIEFGTAWLARELDTYRQAVAIGTFSELVRQSLIHDYGIEPSRVRVVGAGANVLPNGEPRRADDGRTLVFVGKEWRPHGGPVLLRALPILRQNRPRPRARLAGAPPILPGAPGGT